MKNILFGISAIIPIIFVFIISIPFSAFAAENPLLNDFVLYAEKEVKLKEIKASVGHVGSNNKIMIGKKVSGTITGNLSAIGKIDIKGNITINGNITTNKKLHGKGQLIVLGTTNEQASLLKIALPTLSFSANGPDINVPKKGSQILMPGSYNNVRVKKLAKLRLSSGTYYIKKLLISRDASVVVDLSKGQVTLNVEKKFEIGNSGRIRIEPAGSGTAQDIIINVLKDVKIKKYAIVRGRLFAPNDDVKFERNSRLEGSVYAKKIRMDKGSSFSFQTNSPPMVITPDVIGFSLNNAKAEIVSAGLSVGTITTAYNNTVPAGDVVSQDPQPEKSVIIGFPVDLVVSDGNAPELMVSISADPETIFINGSSTLEWSSSNADSVSIDQGIGNISLNGTMSVTPTKTTTYTITATGQGVTKTDNVTVTIANSAPVANAQSVITNEDTIVAITLTGFDPNNDPLTYKIVSGPAHGIITGTAPYLNFSPDINYHGQDSFTFLVNDGKADSEISTISITINPINDPPGITFSQSSEIIISGEAATLYWTSTDAQSVYIDNGIGSVSLNGSVLVSPQITTTYTISATGTTGSAGAQAVVKVMGNPEPLQKGSFGEQYQDLIPVDAAVNEYDPKRFALITGMVQDINGFPIADVSVIVHGFPEYGTVNTNAAGQFFIPVESENTMTLAYQKQGLITVHRQAVVPWNDIAVADTITMITEDTANTTLTFDGNHNTIISHQSSEVTDEFGSRALTMIFTGDNQAYLVDEEGKDVKALATITTRATEFTTPETMPAILPPNSAYTYCAEFAVDGVQRVRFEKPVITWINNFLGFDVGEVVPVGYYDRDEGVWKPSDNGIVVKLLDTDYDGIVDAIDTTGDGNPNDLNNNDSFNDEVTGLDDGAIYKPGDTFWRVAISHFSPWDFNWPYGPPLDAIDPNPIASPDADLQKKENRDCENYNSSFVEERSRIFHEEIPVPGTDMMLHYTSSRVKGYKTVILIPASGDTIPESLKGIIVKMNVAGRVFEKILDPLPDQTAEFTWDGFDSLGKLVNSPIKAHITIGFKYDLIYYKSSSDIAQAFAQFGDTPTFITGRQDMIVWKQSDILLYQDSQVIVNGGGALARGWTLSTHHFGSMKGPTLFRGDGTKGGNYVGGIISTQLGAPNPNHITMDSSGNFYISSTPLHRIGKVDTNGNASTLAGNASSASCGGYGGPAVDAQILYPEGVCLDSAGNLYLSSCHRVHKIDTNGYITTVAGNGFSGFTGDGGPAVDASLNSPSGLAIDAVGNLYIADNWNHRIRKVDTNGIITTVAGSENWQNGIGDGGLATQAIIQNPDCIFVDSSGNLYIAAMHRIRKVDISGIITTVAGNGTPGYSGDAEIATQATLNSPEGIYVDQTGNLYIVDTSNNRIRKVDTYGIITTVAGNGTNGYSGDGGPATKASFSFPEGIYVDSTGDLYIADTNNNRVRKVAFHTIHGTESDEMIFSEENGLGHIMSRLGHHQKTIDLDTGAVLRKFEYDEDNTLISISDRFERQINIERDANGVPTAIVSPDGIRTDLVIGVDNHLTQIINADGSFYNFEYTSEGLMTAKIDPGGNRFDHIFDSQGRLTDSLDEEDGHWNYTRTVQGNGDILINVLTAEGNLTTYLDHTLSTGAYTSTITSPAGGQTFFTESADGLTTNKSLACGMNLEFLYDLDTEYQYKYVKQMSQTTLSGLTRTIDFNKTYEDTNSDGIKDRIIQTFDLNNKSLTIVNNVFQSERLIISPEGRQATAVYDPDTLATISNYVPGLEKTEYSFFISGRPDTIITGTRETSFIYDENGFLSSITDPLNTTTTFTNDLMGRVTYIDRPDGSGIGYAYDENGNMTVLTTQLSVDHLFGYNRVNSNSLYTTPLSGSYSYEYDKDRRLVKKNFPSGKAIILNYDNPMDTDDKSRLWQIQTPEDNIDYTYSCSNKIESISKGSESITLDYDAGLVTSLTLAGTLNQTLDYTYNNDFILSFFTYAGTTQDFTYDLDGLLIGAGDFTISRYNEMDVNETGFPYQVSDNSIILDRVFNTYGETNAQAVSIFGSTVYSWDVTERSDDGRIKTRTETIAGTIADTTIIYKYTYDSMNRLKEVEKDGIKVEEYTYDLNGARTQTDNTLRNITGLTCTYDDESHLLTAGTTSFLYDQDGFLASKITTTGITYYTYSSRGELLNVTLEDGTLIEYLHDPYGRRIAKKVDGTVTRKYLWQGLTKLLAVYDGSDSLLMRFKYADGRMPMAMEKPESTYYFAYDQVGSLMAVADSSGNMVKQIEYDTFGFILTDTDTDFEIPFGFAGGLLDSDTGLVRFGYRDYDPDIGRWTAKDPIGFAGGDTDLYGYVLNDPVNLVDPTGEIAGVIIGAVAGAYGGFLSGMQSGRMATAVASGIAGGAAGSLVGIIMPGASSALGGMIGGAISGALGGAFGGAFGKKLNDPCSSTDEIIKAAEKGALIGATSGALGGALSGAAAAVGMNNAAVGVATANITAPISWGLGIDW
ncbi:RHS repeat-associated core domain-containing protein [Desulfobacula sp.]|uniref:NHL domain-containing protein n=1 Tax=Desulfobacula sp. TaxID=2593537 RepID=UPI001D8388E9|nr:PASTA domain-containing protein [Desulfobacula sp.]